MLDNRNLILAVVLSVVILLGSQFYFESQRPPAPPPGTAEQSEQAGGGAVPTPGAAPTRTSGQGAEIPAAPGTGAGGGAAGEDRATLIAAGPRVKIRSPRLHGSISLKGGRIDDLTLADYHETLDPESAEIVLLTPHGAKDAYFAEFGWVAAKASQGIAVPSGDTLWTADRDELTPDTPVTLTWDNGAGLRFSRTIALDGGYMFTMTQRVENTGATSVGVFPYGLVSRRTTPKVTGFIILHEGLLGVFDSTLLEVDYDEVKEKGSIEQETTGGWLGITDKYWLMALVPDQKTPVGTRFIHRLDGGVDKYQVDYLAGQMDVAPGATIEAVNHLFAGAKEVTLLDGYEEKLGVVNFDLSIDFGWFYFLTKPIFYTLIFINDHIANFGLSILALTVGIKLLFFPLANKSYKAMSKMKKLQPEMIKLRERFGEDKVRLNQEMMALYKREKTNPASGCLPIVIQIPVFFSLYKVLFVTIEMRQAPFFGWIQDLSAPDPTTVFNLFGLIPFTPPDFMMIGVWPLIMGITMFLQQKLNPQPPDPLQAKIFMFLPIMFTFLLARFPAGLVIYWAWNNLLSIIQQKLIMIRMGVK